MPFDGLMLYKLSQELKIIKNYRISKIHQLSETDVLFILRGDRRNHNLIISTSSDNSRICLSQKEFIPNSTPLFQTMFMRKHFEGYIINDIYTHSCDRIIIIEVNGSNEIGDFEKKKIVFELMGRNSNLILLKEDNTILDSLKRYGLFDSNRTILPNALYEFPESSKIDPTSLSLNQIEDIFNSNNITSVKEIMSTFLGISPLLASIIINSKHMPSKLYDIINSTSTALIFNNKNKRDFYFYNDNFEIIKTFTSLNELVDEYYYNTGNIERIKQVTNNLKLQVNKILNRSILKLEKLNNEYIQATNNEQFKIYGELLLSYSYLNDYNPQEITLLNYYNNEDITISLDPMLTLVENANVYFKKYHKSKNAKLHLLQQIDITKNEIEYLNIINTQIDNSNLNDIEEIIEELEKEKYLTKKTKKNKKHKTTLTSFITEEGTEIMLGKNNVQNETLTHKLSLHNEMWFHVKDGAGSHVVVKKNDNLTEMDIRTVANIAAYYSQHKHSSSVHVMYTKIRNIKKIPQKRSCFVTVSNEKSIYIDPNFEEIAKLKVKK